MHECPAPAPRPQTRRRSSEKVTAVEMLPKNRIANARNKLGHRHQRAAVAHRRGGSQDRGHFDLRSCGYFGALSTAIARDSETNPAGGRYQKFMFSVTR